MKRIQPHRIKTISDYHQLMEIQKPGHPLISVINFESIKHIPGRESALFNRNITINLKIGRKSF